MKTEFHGNSIIQIDETLSLDAQGIGALQDAMEGRQFDDSTDVYGHTNLWHGFHLGKRLRADGWHFVSSQYEEADYYREPRFTATVVRAL